MRIHHPGKPMLDDRGNPVLAYAPGFLHHEGVWYWYGEAHLKRQDFGNRTFDGIHVYSSRDLNEWRFRGMALSPDPEDPEGLPRKFPIGERAKVVYNRASGRFVMWLRIAQRDPGYDTLAGVAVSDGPLGPFRLIRRFRPVMAEPDMLPDEAHRQNELGCAVFDPNLFVDEDGRAYLIHGSEGLATLHIHELNEDYTDVKRPAERGKTWNRVLPGMMREAPALFRWRGHVYLFSSGCTGYEPNFLHVARAPHPLGPWEMLGDPCVGPDAETGCRSQPAWVLPMKEYGPDAFIYIGDRWQQRDLAASPTLWLPFKMGFDAMPRLHWLPEWSVDVFRPRSAPAPVRNLRARVCDSRGAQMMADSVALTWDDSPGADGYTIWRNGDELDFTTGTRCTAPLAPPGVPCRFAVRAWNVAGGSAEAAGAVLSPEYIEPFLQPALVCGDAGGSSPAVFQQGKARDVYLSDLHWNRSWSTFTRIYRDTAWDGGALRIGPASYAKGLFCHAHADIEIDTGGVYDSFESDAGLAAGFPGRCECRVFGDGRPLFESGVLTDQDSPVKIAVSIRGVHRLRLEVVSLGRGPVDGRFVWGGARICPQHTIPQEALSE